MALPTFGLSLLGCESQLRRRFDSFERAGDWKGAVRVLQQQVRVTPRDPEAQFLLGRALLRQGDFVAARKALIASTAASPKYERLIDFLLTKYWRVEMQRGTEAMASGQMGQATTHFENAVALKPEENDGQRALGDASLLAGDFRRAVEAYKTVVARDPKDWRARDSLGEAYFRLGDYARSVKLTEEALGLKPGLPEALQRLAYAYERLGKMDQALASFDRAIEARFSAPVARDYVALALKEKRYRRGAAVLQSLLQHAAADTAALRALADAYLAMDDLHAAARAYEKLLAMDPGEPNARRALFMVYMLTGQTEKAKKLIQEVGKPFKATQRDSGRKAP